ncbi:MAG: M23 family metallopeptidase [Thermoanaerobacterales bacterium]|nr:M23 family metallopeptidase [Bacillota bacterium]MDI6906472.1 M23 family metallopeptidase [Thermoanaerobacterales bacterium]
MIFRVGVAALLLVIILGLRGEEGGLGGQVRDRLAYVLTTEWDYRPVLGRVVDFGLQTVSVNTPLLEDLPYRKGEEPPGPPATEVMKPADLPALPVSGRVLRGYGWTIDSLDGMERFHPGVDITCAEGTPVKAVLAGTVAQVGDDRLYGPYVLLNHGGETYTLYAQVQDIQVKEGEEVSAGQVLAHAGAEGEVGEAGLHFEYREGSKLVDPLTKFDLAQEGDVHPAGP